MKNGAINNILLLTTAFIWGSAFVAQKAGMDYLEPLTFNYIRSFLGAFALLILIVIFKIKKGPNCNVNKWEERCYTLRAGVITGIVLAFAGGIQQVGMVSTTASKAGFISSLYIILVPVISMFLGEKVPKTLWIGVFLGACGLYFLCAPNGFSGVGFGDILVMISAVLFAIHILVIAHYAPKVDSVKLSCVQFFVAGFICFIPSLIFENPTMQGFTACIPALLYAGVFSSAVAYTLQIVAQKDTNPALASLLLSFESVFSVIAGALVLHESLSPKEMLGCVLLFVAVLIAQIKCPKTADSADIQNVNCT